MLIYMPTQASEVQTHSSIFSFTIVSDFRVVSGESLALSSKVCFQLCCPHQVTHIFGLVLQSDSLKQLSFAKLFVCICQVHDSGHTGTLSCSSSHLANSLMVPIPPPLQLTRSHSVSGCWGYHLCMSPALSHLRLWATVQISTPLHDCDTERYCSNTIRLCHGWFIQLQRPWACMVASFVFY